MRGLLVRHLVLPCGRAGTAAICRFIKREISADTYLNIMAQYHPCYKAFDVAELGRALAAEEFADAISAAHEEGLYRLDRIEPRSSARILKII